MPSLNFAKPSCVVRRHRAADERPLLFIAADAPRSGGSPPFAASPYPRSPSLLHNTLPEILRLHPDAVDMQVGDVGSGHALDHSQNMTVAAKAIAERYVYGHLS